MVSPVAYKLAKSLVEQNIGCFRRVLTREELLQFGGLGSKNELRRKGLCFICKEPWRPNHSCLSDVDDVAEVEKEKIPYVCQDEDSSSHESMGSYEDTSGENQLSCGVDDSRPNLSSNV